MRTLVPVVLALCACESAPAPVASATANEDTSNAPVSTMAPSPAATIEAPVVLGPARQRAAAATSAKLAKLGIESKSDNLSTTSMMVLLAYAENELKADRQYKNMPSIFHGAIKSVERTESGRAFVTFSARDAKDPHGSGDAGGLREGSRLVQRDDDRVRQLHAVPSEGSLASFALWLRCRCGLGARYRSLGSLRRQLVFGLEDELLLLLEEHLPRPK